MSKQIKVYTASKTNHAKHWLDLRAEWPEVHFTARWPSMIVAEIPEIPSSAMQFWQDDLEDVRAADVVLVYAEACAVAAEDGRVLAYEKLRGALVEAGMGLALGKRVIVVGDAPDYGTWQYHPLCLKVKDLEEARKALDLLSRYPNLSQEGLEQLLGICRK